MNAPSLLPPGRAALGQAALVILLGIAPLTQGDTAPPLSPQAAQLQPQVSTLIHAWLALLQHRPTTGATPADLLDHTGFRLEVIGTTLTTPSQVHNWLLRHHTDMISGTYHQEPWRLVTITGDLAEIEFTLQGEVKKADKPTELFALKQRWKIRLRANRPPQIHTISEQFMAPKLSSGARIQC